MIQDKYFTFVGSLLNNEKLTVKINEFLDFSQSERNMKIFQES